MGKQETICIRLSAPGQIEGVPEVIKLVPLGRVKSTKGDFVVDAESYREMCKNFQERGLDLVIDYEHQTLEGWEAPAAGWIKELTLSEDAICGRVEWTPRAADYLKNREYRYLSPVVMVRANDRKALRLQSAALTNVPAVDNMFAIVNKDFEDGGNQMDFIKQAAALLGLGEDASEAEVLAALKSLVDESAALKESTKKTEEVVANKTVLGLLALKDNASTAEVTAKIAALMNPAGFVPAEQYNQVMAKLQQQESAGLVEMALKEGKIAPAQRGWAEGYAKADPEGFQKFLERAVPVVPMQALTLSARPVKRDAIDPEIARQLGISAEDIDKYGKGV